MTKEYIGKYIRFTQTTMDILDDLIEHQPGINNYAEAVRYAVLSLKDPLNDRDVQRKINTIAKNIDVLTEMVAGGFHAKDVKAIGKAEDTYIYEDAKRNVESKIQRSTTIKSNIKKSNMKQSSIKEPEPVKQSEFTSPTKSVFTRSFT